MNYKHQKTVSCHIKNTLAATDNIYCIPHIIFIQDIILLIVHLANAPWPHPDNALQAIRGNRGR